MTRTMYDSTTVADIPAKATMVAGYIDGNYRTVDALHERFPKARVVTITVNGSTPGAEVIDRENGDASAATAVTYAKVNGATIYTYLAALPELCAAMDKGGLSHSTPIWTAHYTGKPHLCGATCFAPYNLPFSPHVVATQYADPKTSGGHYDVSVVADYWPGIDPPKPPPGHRLAISTRLAVRLVTRRMNRRHQPLTAQGRKLLLALRSAVNHALNVK